MFQNAIKLNQRVAIYVPATDNVNQAADIERFALEMKAAMHQEAVSVEVNRELYIIG